MNWEKREIDNEVKGSIYFINIKEIHPFFTENLVVIHPLDSDIVLENKEGKKTIKEKELYVLNPDQLCFFYSEKPSDCLVMEFQSSLFTANGKPKFNVSENLEIGEIEEDLLTAAYYWIIMKRKEEKFSSKEERNIAEYIVNLLKNSLENYYSEVSSDNTNAEKMIKKAVMITADREGIKNTLTEMSEKIGISLSYLSKIFKEITGFNFTGYNNKVRLYNAIELLTSNCEYPMDMLSVKAGFNSQKTMNRTFSKILGQTPTNIKNKYSNYERSDISKISSIKQDFSNIPKTFASIDKDKKEIFHLVENEDAVSEYVHNNFFKTTFDNKTTMLTDYTREIKELALRTVYVAIQKKNENYYFLVDGYSVKEEVFLDIIENLYYQAYNKFEIIFEVDIFEEEDYFLNADDIYTLLDRVNYELTPLFEKLIFVRKLVKDAPILIELKLKNTYKERNAILNMEKAMEKIRNSLNENIGGRNIYIGLDIEDRYKDELFFKNIDKNMLEFIDFMRFDVDEIPKNTDSIEQQINKLKELVIDGKKKLEDIDPEKNMIYYVGNLNMDIDIQKIPYIYRGVFENILAFEVYHSLLNEIKGVRTITVKDGDKKFKAFHLRDPYGFKMPLMHAFRQIKDFSGDVIYSSNRMFITKAGENYCGYIYADIDRSLESVLANEDERKTIETHRVILKNISGKYKIKTNHIDCFNGSPFYHLNSFENYRSFNIEERNYINSRNIPEMKIREVEIDGEYIEDMDLKAFEIVFIKLIKF